MKNFPKNLAFLLQRSGDPQIALATFIGVSQPCVSSWLAGKTKPRVGVIEKIAQYFEITADDLTKEELPHRKEIQALEEVERELRQLRSQWDEAVAREKVTAKQFADKSDYATAVIAFHVAKGTEKCCEELTKVLELYFPSTPR